jgi:hypothetical protein
LKQKRNELKKEEASSINGTFGNAAAIAFSKNLILFFYKNLIWFVRFGLF